MNDNQQKWQSATDNQPSLRDLMDDRDMVSQLVSDGLLPRHIEVLKRTAKQSGKSTARSCIR